MDKESKAYRSGEFEDMFTESEITKLAAEEVVAYSASKYRLQEIQHAIDYAADDSYQRGKESGLKLGREEGILEGQRLQAIRMAKDLLMLGMAKADISRISGLSLEEISLL